jgi:hypothetical protein
MTNNKTTKNHDLTPNQRAVLDRGYRMLAGWRRPVAVRRLDDTNRWKIVGAGSSTRPASACSASSGGVLRMEGCQRSSLGVRAATWCG